MTFMLLRCNIDTALKSRDYDLLLSALEIKSEGKKIRPVKNFTECRENNLATSRYLQAVLKGNWRRSQSIHQQRRTGTRASKYTLWNSITGAAAFVAFKLKIAPFTSLKRAAVAAQCLRYEMKHMPLVRGVELSLGLILTHNPGCDIVTERIYPMTIRY